MTKEKPQQNGGRGKIMFGIKPHTRQRCLEGSNKTCVHQDPETPQRLSQTCVWLSCGGTGQKWPAAGAGVLGTATWVT